MCREERKMLTGLLVIVALSLWAADAAPFFLPDTGQTSCYGSKGKTKVIPCPAPGQSAAQDGSYLFFPPSYTAADGITVRDNNTRLLWQQGGDGLLRPWEEAASYCQDLNDGGYHDWRLPSALELFSLVDFADTMPPVFPLNLFNFSYPEGYWTKSSFGCGSSTYVVVNFASGSISSMPKTNRYNARCVRSSPGEQQLLVNNGDATISDQRSGLTWQQIEGGRMNWGAALGYCESLSLGKWSDWRLPNVRELASLFDKEGARPIDRQYFPQAVQNYYWSSTSNARNPENKWIIDYFSPIISGAAQQSDKDTRTNSVRCVRGEKIELLDGQEMAVTPVQLDFFVPGEGTRAIQRLTINNDNSSFLAIDRVISPSPPFSILADDCSGRWLGETGDSCSLDIAFHPQRSGNFTDTLTIESNDADHPRTTIPLSGYFSPVQGGAFLLVDSGQSDCFDPNGRVTPCPLPGSPRAQDGSYRQNPPSLTINSNGTVADPLTGLLWQQQNDGVMRTWAEAESYCSSLLLAGLDGWRLPSKKELFAQVDYGHYDPAIDTAIFPLPPAFPEYWTATTFRANSADSWTIDFSSGGLPSFHPRSQTALSRCVYGTPLPAGILVDNQNATISDQATGLIWQQTENPNGLWETALQACENLTLAGYNDWRLPNIKELESLIDDTRNDPALDNALFPGTPCGLFAKYWSATTSSTYKTEFDFGYMGAIAIDFSNGAVSPGVDKSYSTNLNYRCVRGGATALLPTIIGTVRTEPDGGLLAGVTVTARDAARQQTTTISAEDGSYLLSNLAPGEFLLTFEKSGYQHQDVTGRIDFGQRLTIDNRLTPLPPLTLSFSSPANGARVYSSPLLVSGGVSNSAQVTVNGLTATVDEGAFTVSVPLVEGENTLTASAVDAYDQRSSESLSVTLVTLGALSGVVTAADHMPLAGAQLLLTDSLGQRHTTSSDTDGRYTLAAIPQGTYGLIITLDDYAPDSTTGVILADQIVTVTSVLKLQPPLIRLITTSSLTGSSVTILWTTDQPADSLIEYGLTPTYGDILTNPTLTDSHSLTLNGLAPGTIYHFRVTSANSLQLSTSSIDNSFITLAPPEISAITVKEITPESAVIVWTTDQPTQILLDYGATTDYGRTMTDPLLATTHALTLTGLDLQSPYHYRITATNSYDLATISNDQSFTTAGPITLTLLAPTDNTVLSQTEVLVQGTFSNLTGKETGITINGQLAVINGNSFSLNKLPLNEGTNTIQIHATDTGGYTANTVVTVTAAPTGDYLRMVFNLESGITPFAAVFHTESSFRVESLTLSYLGPGPADLSNCPDYGACEVKLSTEGVYTFIASAPGPDGKIYQDTVLLTVLSKSALDRVLQAKWGGVKNKLAAGDIEGGLESFVGHGRELYRPAFTALRDKLPQIVAEMADIEMVYGQEQVAKYRIKRTQTIQGVPQEITYYIYFSRGNDGLWKIQNF